ncbi:MAG: tetratricopeptide repeat protein [Reyranellaceae bacterium]
MKMRIKAFLAGAIAVAALAGPPLVAEAQQQRAPRNGLAPSPTGAYLAGRYASRISDYATGVVYIDRALALNPGDTAMQFLAFRMRIAAGRFASAMELAPRIADQFAHDPIAPLVLALDAAKRKDYTGAEKFLARIPSGQQLGFMRPYLLAWVKVGQKDYAAAMASLESSAPTGPGGKPSAVFLLHSGLVDEIAGRKDEAQRKLAEAYASPDAATVRIAMALAAFHRRNGKPEEAEKVLRAFHDKAPEFAPLDALLADKFQRLPTVADGMAEVLFDVFAALATNAGRNETVEDAAVLFGRLTIEMRPDYDLARILLADLFVQNDQQATALEIYRGVDKNSPFSWRTRIKMAMAVDQSDRTEEAVAQIRAMIDERKDRADAAQSLGDLLRSRERFEEAAKAYETAVQRTGTPQARDWPLFYASGIALERSGQWDKAEASFRKALELQPDQPYVLNYLAYSWIDKGINLREGKEMLERAVRQRPNDGAIVDSLAWAHYRLGEYPRAVELLERAVALQSTDWTINDHLGDAYWRVGRKQEARFQWQRALTLKPDEDKIKAVEDKIANGLPDGETTPSQPSRN